MIIYVTENLITGKCYVGQTALDNQDYLGSGLLMLKAIAKYGKENFKRIIVEECSFQEELDKQEIFWIKALNTLVPNGYNLMTGGFGGKHSEKSKQKMSESTKGVSFSEDHRRKISEANKGEKNSMYGKRHSEKTRQLISDANKGEKNSNYGKHHSEKAKQKMREVKLGIPFSEEHKRKLKEAWVRRKVGKGEKHPMFGKKGKDNPNYGSKRTEESIQRMRVAQRKSWVRRKEKIKLKERQNIIKKNKE